MKIKLFLMAAVMTVAAVSFVGCKSDEPTPPADVKLNVAASNITPTKFTGSVTPENNTVRYFASYLTEDEFAEFGTNEGITEYMGIFVENLQTDNPTKYLDDLIKEVTATGSSSGSFDYLTPESVVYFFAVGLDLKGNVTTGLNSVKVTLQAAYGEDPEVEMEAVPGDNEGNNSSTTVMFKVGIKNVSYGKALMAPSVELDALMKRENLTLDEVVNVIGSELTPADLEAMSNGTATYLAEDMEPGQKMAFIVKVISAGGKMVVERIDGETDLK